MRDLEMMVKKAGYVIRRDVEQMAKDIKDMGKVR